MLLLQRCYQTSKENVYQNCPQMFLVGHKSPAEQMKSPVSCLTNALVF